MKKEITVEEGSRIIAEFMGEFRVSDDKYATGSSHNVWYVGDLIYHSSWSWLMPVVEKIESLGFEFSICQNSVLIMNDWKKIPEPVTLEKLPANKRFERTEKSDSKIVSTWQACVAFIQWLTTYHSKQDSLTL